MKVIVFVLWLFGVIVSLAILAGIIYTAIHFIVKVW